MIFIHILLSIDLKLDVEMKMPIISLKSGVIVIFALIFFVFPISSKLISSPPDSTSESGFIFKNLLKMPFYSFCDQTTYISQPTGIIRLGVGFDEEKKETAYQGIDYIHFKNFQIKQPMNTLISPN